MTAALFMCKPYTSTCACQPAERPVGVDEARHVPTAVDAVQPRVNRRSARSVFDESGTGDLARRRGVRLALSGPSHHGRVDRNRHHGAAP